MKIRTHFKTQSIALLTMLVTACASHKSMPATETFSLPVTTITKTSAELHQPIIRMMPTTIAPQFANNFFVYRISASQYLTDPYRCFLISPNAEATNYLEHQLAPSINGSLVTANNLTSAKYILQTNIAELYGDYQNKLHPTAVVSIEFTLYSSTNGEISQLGSTRLRQTSPIKANDPSSLMTGYAKDFNLLSQQASLFINRQLKPGSGS